MEKDNVLSRWTNFDFPPLPSPLPPAPPLSDLLSIDEFLDMLGLRGGVIAVDAASPVNADEEEGGVGAGRSLSSSW